LIASELRVPAIGVIHLGGNPDARIRTGQFLNDVQTRIDGGRDAARSNDVPFIDHPLADHLPAVGFQFLERARVRRRALVSKKACGAEQESAGAYRYLEPRGAGRFQPIDKIPVMLEAPVPNPPGTKSMS